MLISLYTSRVVLETLGVEDFGIYNVVGGVVAMFSLLSGTLSAVISRFLTFELGRGDAVKLHKVFCSSVNIQLVLSAIILVLSETVGVWFLNSQMNIPDVRMSAANRVFQCSVITFILGLISTPYNAAVISHERMSFFAVVSIGEAILKLLIVVSLRFAPADKLITYAVALAILALAIRVLYGVYCSRNFSECHYSLVVDKSLVKQMFSFAGWNFWGSGSWVLMSQGINILINIFFGVAFNAARGIATQVEAAVNSFVSSFTTALNPQITKDYARGDIATMLKLVYSGSKYSFFLTLFIALPLLLETETVLGIWLKNVPDYTVLFVRLTLISSLIYVFSNTLITAKLATGDIRNYQLIVGGLAMTIFPITWVLFLLGFPVWVSYIVVVVVFITQLFARVWLLQDDIGLDRKYFFTRVVLRGLLVAVLASVLPFAVTVLIDGGFSRLFLTVLVSFASTVTSVYFIGLDSVEKETFRKISRQVLNKLHFPIRNYK